MSALGEGQGGHIIRLKLRGIYLKINNSFNNIIHHHAASTK